MLRIYIHELCTLESVFLIIRNSTVKDCLACDSVIADTAGAARIVGRIQRMASDSWNCDDIRISLESCIHRPQYIVHIEAVYILINQEYMFQLTECRECQKRCLSLSSFITGRKLLKLQNGHIFPAAR